MSNFVNLQIVDKNHSNRQIDRKIGSNLPNWGSKKGSILKIEPTFKTKSTKKFFFKINFKNL